MSTVDKLKNGLINKILQINNKELLEALNNLVSESTSNAKPVKLTKEQQEMLEMSEADIKAGRLISQEAMNKRNLEWLNEQ